MKSYSISQRNKSRGSKVWYGRTFENGVLIEERSLKTTSRIDAKAWLDLMNASRFTPASLLVASSVQPTRPIVGCINSFMDNYDGRTMELYRTVTSSLLSWCNANGLKDIGEITIEKADEYIKSLDITDASKRVYINILRTMFNWSIDTYSLTIGNPFLKVRMPKVVLREKKFLTSDVIDRLLDAAPSPKWRLFWALMAFAGLRHFEASSFGPSMIDGGTIHLIGKGGKDARIPISERLKEELDRLPIEDGIFDDYYMYSSKSNATLKETLKSIGVDTEGITNHTLRHSFASNLARAGVQEKFIQKLARHSNIATTMQVYTHVLDEDLFKAINTKKEG